MRYDALGGGSFGDIDEIMLKGIRSMIVLIHIKKKSTYPYALLKKFQKSRHPMLHSIDKSQLYNILNFLEKKGYVRSKVSLTGAKAQKVYSVTPRGDAVASSFRKIFSKFVKNASVIIRGAFSE